MSKRFHYRLGITALSLFFVICICLPLAELALGLDPTPVLNEYRELAPLPSLASPVAAVLQHPTGRGAWSGLFQALAWYPADFTSYFDDHFGFRRLLIRTHSVLVLLGWPDKGEVIVGRQGWLFFAEPRAKASYQTTTLLSPQELAAWQRELERRRDWYAAQGSDYLVALAPEKSTMYAQFMPANVPRFGQRTRLDQMVEFLAANSDLQVIDPRDALVQASAQHRTYHRTDSHWNAWGGFVACQQILVKLSERHPNLHPKTLKDYTIREQEIQGKDLTVMLGLEHVIHEQAILVEPLASSRPQAAETGVESLPHGLWWAFQPEAYEVPDSDAPTAVVVRDSFGNALIPFLAEHFRRSLFIHWYSMDESVILRERPDIVIEQMAERELQEEMPPRWGM